MYDENPTRRIRDNPPYVQAAGATDRLRVRGSVYTNVPSVFDFGAAAPVGPDRWAGREYPDGAPSGRALPVKSRPTVQKQRDVGISRAIPSLPSNPSRDTLFASWESQQLNGFIVRANRKFPRPHGTFSFVFRMQKKAPHFRETPLKFYAESATGSLTLSSTPRRRYRRGS